MVAKKTVAVAADNLVRLGAKRLAEILLELAGEQPGIKRRLRFELAGEADGEMIAAEMNKRITTLRSARSFVNWQKRASFVRDLDLTRTTITERVGRSGSVTARAGAAGSARWKPEPLMTFSTSLVAVWYSSDSLKITRPGLQRAIRFGAGDRDHCLLGEGL